MSDLMPIIAICAATPFIAMYYFKRKEKLKQRRGLDINPGHPVYSWRKNDKNENHKTMQERFSTLLKTDNTTLPLNIEFYVGGNRKYIKANKWILSFYSPVFKDMFESNIGTIETKDLPNTDPEIFELFVSYIYTRKLQLKTLLEAVQLLKVAHQYKVLDLVEICIRYVNENTFLPENVVSTFEIAEILNIEPLRQNALAFILQNFEDIMQAKDFLNFTTKNLLEILQMDNLIVYSEYTLCFAMISWAGKKIQERGANVDGSNLKAILGEAVNSIRFPSMDSVRFTDCLLEMDRRATQILSKKEINNIYMHQLSNGAASSITNQWSCEIRQCHQNVQTYNLTRKFENMQNVDIVECTDDKKMYDRFRSPAIGIDTYLCGLGFESKSTNATVLNLTLHTKYHNEKEVVKRKTSVSVIREGTLFFVYFAKPVHLTSDTVYSVSYKLLEGNIITRKYSTEERIISAQDDQDHQFDLTYMPSHSALCALKIKFGRD